MNSPIKAMFLPENLHYSYHGWLWIIQCWTQIR